MNYQRIYDQLMDKAKKENRVKGGDVYYESHHIAPMFLHKTKRGRNSFCKKSPNHPSNLVLLTFREHVLAHVLLCKIYENTKYYHHSVNSINLMLVNKNKSHIRCSDAFNQSANMQYIKEKYSKEVSKMRKGCMVVKDAITDEMIGWVDKNHPNIVSGKWVFFHKGIKRSEEFKNAISRPGYSNMNFSGYTDEMLSDSFIESCLFYGYIPSKNEWIDWATANDKPHIKYCKSFRFDGKGFSYLYEIAEKTYGVKYNRYFTRTKNFKNFKKLDGVVQGEKIN